MSHLYLLFTLLLVLFLHNKGEKKFYIKEPNIFVTEKIHYFLSSGGGKGNPPLLIDVMIHYFSFLLQIENHISDIDNWVKVSFSSIPGRTRSLFLPIKNPFGQYPVEPFAIKTATCKCLFSHHTYSSENPNLPPSRPPHLMKKIERNKREPLRALTSVCVAAATWLHLISAPPSKPHFHVYDYLCLNNQGYDLVWLRLTFHLRCPQPMKRNSILASAMVTDR